MKSVFRPAVFADLGQVTGLLRRAFAAPPDAPFLNPAILRWKYWEPRADFPDSRSYVLEREGVIVAHAGIWPVMLSNGGAEARGIQMIDWAAAPDAPGAGLALVQKLSRMFDFIYSIGGSEATQRALPAFGFRGLAETWDGARPIRPLRQILSHGHRNWKLAPRLVRNAWWALYPRAAPPAGWVARAIAPQQIPADLAAAVASQHRFLPRPPAFFDYLLSCPAARFELRLLCDPHGPRGWLALSVVRRQARVAGIWLRDPDPDSWTHAYSLALREAAGIADVCEIAARGAGESSQGAVACGFRLSPGPPVFLLDPQDKLAGGVQFQLCDDDAAFADSGESSYWT